MKINLTTLIRLHTQLGEADNYEVRVEGEVN